MRIALPRKDRTKPSIVWQGTLREVWKIDTDKWQVKITTDYTNLDNLYLTLTDEEIAQLKEEIAREEKKGSP